MAWLPGGQPKFPTSFHKIFQISSYLQALGWVVEVNRGENRLEQEGKVAVGMVGEAHVRVQCIIIRSL